MLDAKFFSKISTNVIARYRKHIFDPAGKGSGAKDVYGKSYPAYSTQYGKLKKAGRLRDGDVPQSKKFKASKAPVMTGLLLKDLKYLGKLDNGFKFGFSSWGAKVKSLQQQGRPISTKDKPIPDPVTDYIMEQAQEYTDDGLGGLFKDSTVTIRV